MKLTTTTLILTLTIFVAINAIQASGLKRNGAETERKIKKGSKSLKKASKFDEVTVWCKRIEIKNGDDITYGPIDSENIFQWDTSNTEQTKKAEEQTMAARNMIYFQKPSVKKLIKDMATKLVEIFENDKTKRLINLVSEIKTDADRQILDAEDLKSKKGTSEAVTSWAYLQLEASFKGEKLDILKVVKQIAGEDKDVNSIHITGFLGLLGDLAACNQDIYGRGQNGEPKKEISTILTNAGLIKDFETASSNVWKMFSPDNFYPSSGNPKKSQKAFERYNCVNDDNSKRKDQRSGISNHGLFMDAQNQIVTTKIPAISWDFQTVPKKIIDTCPNEVWAGHYSGSAYELLFIFDALTGKNSAADPDSKNLEDRKVKAALASAFLLATGFHTAIEINWVMQNYLKKGAFGPMYNKDDKNVVTPDTKVLASVCANATKFITDLINEHASQPSLKSERKKN